jgi:hypothetical protein
MATAHDRRKKFIAQIMFLEKVNQWCRIGIWLDVLANIDSITFPQIQGNAIITPTTTSFCAYSAA